MFSTFILIPASSLVSLMQFSSTDKLTSHQPPGKDQRLLFSFTNKIFSSLNIAVLVAILGV